MTTGAVDGEADARWRWRTINGTLTFDELRAAVAEAQGLTLSYPRRPATRRDPNSLTSQAPPPGVVALNELQREQLFPNSDGGKPGRYHERAADLVAFLVAELGLRHPQDDPRRIARGQPERDQLRRELHSAWERWRVVNNCPDLERHEARLVAHAAEAAPELSKALMGETVREIRSMLRERTIEAEAAFYRHLIWPTKAAAYRTEARGRDLAEVIDEQLVFEARSALVRDTGRLLEDVDLQTHEVVVTYVIRPDPGGQPTTSVEPPTARVRRRRGTT